MREYRNRLYIRFLNKITNEKRRQFFERIDNDDIYQVKSNDSITYILALSIYALITRANLTNIFIYNISNVIIEYYRDRRIEALQNLVDLCHVYKSHRINLELDANKIVTI